MLSRRRFISCQFESEGSGKRSTMISGEEKEYPDALQPIASDFSDDMLFREMMRMGKDPSNMERKQMLHEVLDLMKTR